jgi:hypothetical protein
LKGQRDDLETAITDRSIRTWRGLRRMVINSQRVHTVPCLARLRDLHGSCDVEAGKAEAREDDYLHAETAAIEEWLPTPGERPGSNSTEAPPDKRAPP